MGMHGHEVWSIHIMWGKVFVVCVLVYLFIISISVYLLETCSDVRYLIQNSKLYDQDQVSFCVASSLACRGVTQHTSNCDWLHCMSGSGCSQIIYNWLWTVSMAWYKNTFVLCIGFIRCMIGGLYLLCMNFFQFYNMMFLVAIFVTSLFTMCWAILVTESGY